MENEQEQLAPADTALPFGLAPIPKIDIFRSALGQLEGAVAQMQPGDRLGSERQLAEQLNVSRVTVREALRAMESMGKVEIRRNSGTFVVQRQPRNRLDIDRPAEVDAEYICDLCEAREALECAVVRAVVANEEADLTEIRMVLDKAGLELVGTPSPKGSLDLRFENALAHECGNPILMGLQRVVHEMWIDAWVRLGGAVADAPRLHDEHQRILQAIESGDADNAAHMMAEHVNPVDRPYPMHSRPKPDSARSGYEPHVKVRSNANVT